MSPLDLPGADLLERARRLTELELELGVAAGSLEPDELERIARGRRLLEYQRRRNWGNGGPA